MKISYLIMSCITIFIGGCVMGGHFWFNVSGNIPRSDPTKPNNCIIYMTSSSTGEIVKGNRKFDTKFYESFVIIESYLIIKPTAKFYFFTIECEDGKKYKTSQYQIGSEVYDFNEVIEIKSFY